MIRFGFHPGKGSEKVAVAHLSSQEYRPFAASGRAAYMQIQSVTASFAHQKESAGTLPIIRVPRSKNGARPYEFRKRIKR
ncbi:hypothetical protein AGR5A_Lc10072 [Agrobacterium genomosp. 5 str. CFBP 6626]|nr:hypothetical protein AGR5A_Lc10072 [Agrobacterium genomosp. 5 str. CFBP 6626]